MAIIPNFFLNAVVAIGIDIVGGEKQWIRDRVHCRKKRK